MFDIGFFELLLIGIVGLVVIGPERLPSTVRTCALWLGRIKRSISETRQEIEQQLGADDIRRELHNEQVMRNLEKMKDTRAELEARINQWQANDALSTRSKDGNVIDHDSAAAADDDADHDRDTETRPASLPPIADNTELTPSAPPNNDKSQ